MAQRIQLRRDTLANWASVNPILAQGELGLELDTNFIKFGDGATAWNSLLYFSGSFFGGLWNFAGNGGDFPTAPVAGVVYIAEDDHGVLGDADFVSAGAWMLALESGADEFDEYSIKL